MTTQEIADKLVAFCRKADWEGAHNSLYARDAKSIEPYETPAFAKAIEGLDAIREKGKKFDSMVENFIPLRFPNRWLRGMRSPLHSRWI